MILSKAEMAAMEEMDDVKHMNQMQLYAKCVTIRDAQIEEKKHMMLEEEEEERRLDLMMEIERLKVGRDGPKLTSSAESMPDVLRFLPARQWSTTRIGSANGLRSGCQGP